MKRLVFQLFSSLFFLLFPLALFAVERESLELSPDKAEQIKQLKIKSFSDLQQLTPYESVSVIQKRYLPKTYRSEFNLSASAVINHTFFYLGGASLRAGFFIREDHGFGLEGFVFFTPVDKVVTREMIGPPNLILPFTNMFSKFYGGVYYKWSPIFGKFSFLNKKIVYFDMYFTVGGGMSHFIPGLSQERMAALIGDKPPVPAGKFFPALNMGLGQVFAFSQSWAFNWDLKWFHNFVKMSDQSYNFSVNINLSLGINYYFPEAGYR